MPSLNWTELAASPLIPLALRHLPTDAEFRVGSREMILSAVVAAIRHPNSGLADYPTPCLGRLARECRRLDRLGMEACDDVYLVSLIAMRRRTDFDPFALPEVRALGALTGIRYLDLRDAFGTLALAWQILQAPKNLVLTPDELEQSIN